MSRQELDTYFTKYDLKRLELYSQNMVDYHLIMDLLPTISRLHFQHHIDVHLSTAQSVRSTAQSVRSTAQSVRSTAQSVRSTAQSIRSTAQSVRSTAQSVRGTAQSVGSRLHNFQQLLSSAPVFRISNACYCSHEPLLLTPCCVQAILLGLGLQHKTVEQLGKEIDLPASQILGLFNRCIRKVVQVGTGASLSVQLNH